MNAMVQTLNTAARAFVGFSVPMLVQSSLLILILLAVDGMLRKRVRAVFRYWIWMLVLVKLVLPPSLGSPVSLGTWFGGHLEIPATALLEPAEPVAPGGAEGILPSDAGARARDTTSATPRGREGREARPPSAATDFLLRPAPRFVEPPAPEPGGPATPGWGPITPEGGGATHLVTHPPAFSLNWQGLVILVWAIVVTALLLLLAQRTFFVRGLVAQAQEAGPALHAELDRCREHLGVRRRVSLRLSPNAASPAVCGLARPVILIPQNLAARLHGTDLQAVLFHELAHVQRGDLWISFAQTLLQILYFYNPLLWLANAILRRIREKAVDETVLVAMGEAAAQYPETLVNVAKLAFRRPALSLRLIGVVESKSALTSRIRHILNRPLPKSAKLGLFGLCLIFIIAAVLLPMAKGNVRPGRFSKDVFFRFDSDKTDGSRRSIGLMEISAEYTVSFRPGEKLALVAELYQAGRPMRTLGCHVFPDPARPQKLSTRLTRKHLNEGWTAIEHGLEVTLGDESFRVDGIRVDTPGFYATSIPYLFHEPQLARRKVGRQSYVEFGHLLYVQVHGTDTGSASGRVWIPGGGDIPTMYGDTYFLMVKMLPLSQLSAVQIDPPGSGMQLLDGSQLPDHATPEQRQALADEYRRNLAATWARHGMPLPKLVAHEYYKRGEPIWISVPTHDGGGWKPSLEEIYHDPDVHPFFFLIDGKEYPSRLGFGPFDGGGMQLHLPGELYGNPADFDLPPGRHTVAYGWKDLEVMDPNAPDQPLHFARLATDPVAFEVVEQLPRDYYRQVYEQGWEDILRRSVQTLCTDDMRRHGIFGSLLALKVDKLPFDTAFAVSVQAEGSDRQHPVGELALRAGSNRIMGCDHRVKELDWDTVGDRRWRILLTPAVEVAQKHPPIRAFYGRPFLTDWVSFVRSPQFEQRRRTSERRQDDPPDFGGTIKADRPVDLDRLAARWDGPGEAWPLPAGFELGWSPKDGGTLRIDPNSGVRLLWLPEANARLTRVTAQSRQRLAELPRSQTTQIVPPQGEPTLIAVLSSEGKVYFVRVSKINETWANLGWWEDEETSKQYGSTPAAGPAAAPASSRVAASATLPSPLRQGDCTISHFPTRTSSR